MNILKELPEMTVVFRFLVVMNKLSIPS